MVPGARRSPPNRICPDPLPSPGWTVSKASTTTCEEHLIGYAARVMAIER